MKKVFAVLAVLSLLMVPCISMTATMSDSDLAAITGQSGVTIDISRVNITLGYGTVTYGDLDGFTTAGSLGSDFTKAGYLNIAYLPTVPMHVGIGDIELVIDVGTSVTTSVTAVNIAGTMNGPITIDAIGVLISLDSVNGAAVDYIGNSGSPYPGGGTFDPTYWNSVYSTDKNLGLFCLSNISVLIPTINIQISAH